MGIFKKTIKYSKPSKDLDSKIKNLDEGLKQTGVIIGDNDSEDSFVKESFVDVLPKIHDDIKIQKEEESLYNWRESFISEETEDNFDLIEEDQHKTLDRVEGYISESNKELIQIRDQIFQEISKSTLLNLPEIKEKISKVLEIYEDIQEGLLREPPETKNEDPLTPLDQNFVTIDDLNKHYTLFINRVQEQLSTLGGGGETQLKYLDDIVGIATNASVYDGKFLTYNHSLGKFEFVTVSGGGGGSEDLNTTLGFGNTSDLGMSVGVVTATRAVFTADCGPGLPAVQITGLSTSDYSNHGLLEVGELGFTDANIITSFTNDVDNYTQLIIQNKNGGMNASADIVVNNDRANGYERYGNFGINGSNYDPVDAFSDPNGTYLYSIGGTLTVGTFDYYDLKFVVNNLTPLRFDHSTAVPYFGTEASTISLFNPIAVFTYNSPTYAQIQIQNTSDGSGASIDYIASTDTATDTSEYIDMGINGSGYVTDGLWGPKDGYIYVKGPVSGPGGNLVIGTVDGGDVIFHTSSNASEDERLRISNTGIGIGTANPTSKLEVQGGDIKVGIDTSSGLILTSPNGTKYRLVVDDLGNLSTVLVP